MKICSTCKLSKEKFYPNARKTDGLQTYCVDCAKERSKKRYKSFSVEQKQKMQDGARQKVLRNKQFIWDYLKENPCVDCGETDPIVLEFDHQVNKVDCISTLSGQGIGLEKIAEEIGKCEVRCANCHRRKTAKDFEWYKNIVK